MPHRDIFFRCSYHGSSHHLHEFACASDETSLGRSAIALPTLHQLEASQPLPLLALLASSSRSPPHFDHYDWSRPPLGHRDYSRREIINSAPCSRGEREAAVRVRPRCAWAPVLSNSFSTFCSVHSLDCTTDLRFGLGSHFCVWGMLGEANPH